MLLVYDAELELVSSSGTRRVPYLGFHRGYKQLDLPTYWAGVNTELTAQLDAKGNATKVTIAYPRDAVKQYLAYGAMYRRN